MTEEESLVACGDQSGARAAGQIGTKFRRTFRRDDDRIDDRIPPNYLTVMYKSIQTAKQTLSQLSLRRNRFKQIGAVVDPTRTVGWTGQPPQTHHILNPQPPVEIKT